MNAETYINDIPLSLYVSAYSGVSMSPERRGESSRTEYAQQLAEDYATLHAHAVKGGTLDLLPEEFARFRAGCAKRQNSYLASSSRCISSFITGPSNFPVSRAKKRNDVAHKRLNELIDGREAALKAAIRNLRPDLRPVMVGDSDAVQRLQAELAKLETLQSRMKAINTAHKKFLKDPAIIDVLDLSDADRAMIRNHKPRYSLEPHPFAPYELTNNNANIRRIKERIAVLSVAKATPETVIEADGLRVEDSPADNRIRLFFDGKPDADIRARLKSNGFRWTPSIGAWQSYRNSNSMTLARSFLCKP